MHSALDDSGRSATDAPRETERTRLVDGGSVLSPGQVPFVSVSHERRDRGDIVFTYYWITARESPIAIRAINKTSAKENQMELMRSPSGSIIEKLQSLVKAGKIASIGLIILILSQLSKWLGSLGRLTGGLGVKYTKLIESVVGIKEAEQIREDILGDFDSIVDEYVSDHKPSNKSWTAWQYSISTIARRKEEEFGRGETILSISLAAISVPLALFPFDLLTTFGLSLLFFVLAVVLVSAVSFRIAVIEILAFTDPKSRNNTRLKNMWAWNYWIIGETAVMVIILGIIILGKISGVMRDKTVEEISALPQKVSNGEEVNKKDVIIRIAKTAYDAEIRTT